MEDHHQNEVKRKGKKEKRKRKEVKEKRGKQALKSQGIAPGLYGWDYVAPLDVQRVLGWRGV